MVPSIRPDYRGKLEMTEKTSTRSFLLSSVMPTFLCHSRVGGNPSGTITAFAPILEMTENRGKLEVTERGFSLSFFSYPLPFSE